MSSSESESSNVVYYQPSPDGTVHAVVEQDDRVAYFYLSSDLPNFQTKAVWVRNLVPGPITLDSRDMQQGLAPVLPRLNCSHPTGEQPLVAEQLYVVWFEQGNGAALLENDEVIAVIPPWSGTDGFHGYARDCKTENPVCWPLPNDPELLERIESAKQWWQSWLDENPWQPRQEAQLAALETGLGQHQQYYSIDGKKWPPKSLAWFQTDFGSAWVTMGVSLRPQPAAELLLDTPQQVERIELGAFLSQEPQAKDVNRVARWLSATTNYPWYQQTWLGHGHTTTFLTPKLDNAEDSRGEPIKPGFPYVLLIEHRALVERLRQTPRDARGDQLLACLEPISIPDFRQAPTNLLWVVPITAVEQQVAAGPQGPELIKRLLETPDRLWCDSSPASMSATLPNSGRE